MDITPTSSSSSPAPSPSSITHPAVIMSIGNAPSVPPQLSPVRMVSKPSHWHVVGPSGKKRKRSEFEDQEEGSPTNAGLPPSTSPSSMLSPHAISISSPFSSLQSTTYVLSLQPEQSEGGGLNLPSLIVDPNAHRGPPASASIVASGVVDMYAPVTGVIRAASKAKPRGKSATNLTVSSLPSPGIGNGILPLIPSSQEDEKSGKRKTSLGKKSKKTPTKSKSKSKKKKKSKDGKESGEDEEDGEDMEEDDQSEEEEEEEGSHNGNGKAKTEDKLSQTAGKEELVLHQVHVEKHVLEELFRTQGNNWTRIDLDRVEISGVESAISSDSGSKSNSSSSEDLEKKESTGSVEENHKSADASSSSDKPAASSPSKSASSEITIDQNGGLSQIVQWISQYCSGPSSDASSSDSSSSSSGSSSGSKLKTLRLRLVAPYSTLIDGGVSLPSSLESLEVNEPKLLEEPACNLLVGLGNLKTLSLTSTKIDAVTVRSFVATHCPGLETLRINSHKMKRSKKDPTQWVN